MKVSIKVRKLVMLLVCVMLMAAVPAQAKVKKVRVYKGQPAKYIFLFIGDGMGFPQKGATEAFTGEQLMMNTFPAQGMTTTYAADRFITGSAAAATSLASGQKTNIGMLGMDPGQNHVKSIAEMAKASGKKVGIVSSVSIDHATPAAFYAHVPTRGQYYDIDIALAESGFDFFGGGGLKDPLNKKKNSRNFKGDALEVIKTAGYKVVTDKDEFLALKPADGKVISWNNWLQDSKALPYAMDMGPEDITLPEFTGKAIEMLDNPEGFFLMVEGGKIDWACHANDAAAFIHNTISFDDSVKKAVEFAKKHPKETLIVVTGDHECGGLTLGFAGTKYASHFNALKPQDVSFQKFSDEVVKLWKKEHKNGASFEFFQPTITHFFGLEFDGDAKKNPMVVKGYQLAMLKDAYARTMKGEKKFKDPELYNLYGGYDPLTVSITHVLNNNAGLGWTSFKHTGVPVATSAMGVGSDSFNGYYDNVDVAYKLMSIMGIAPKVYSKNSKVKVAVN
ncbi:alkaline phosphatase [Maridesulfovibrio hydrothermalis]|uniref:Alkaline phosphatase n=1 Tax=Maridesulfovibrio hydrothermalis AM13 = DSM 14728 TaxID=1121451 RepID=L0RD66_9BACT|nr:alkaline phosphatase [Maridesulfovibrio hydrothermalis]CCO24723.1 Alkaline phosphatase [Maridesulfovibrio hydrothermalis AM13 = DSM 14728]